MFVSNICIPHSRLYHTNLTQYSLLFWHTQVTLQGSERWLFLSQPLRIKAFEKNLKMLLEALPDKVIALGNFVSTYMKFFGRKCKIATYGFSKLTDLIEAVPAVAKVSSKSLFSLCVNPWFQLGFGDKGQFVPLGKFLWVPTCRNWTNVIFYVRVVTGYIFPSLFAPQF